MVYREKKLSDFRLIVSAIGVWVMALFVLMPEVGLAQGNYPGFGLEVSWTQHIELSKKQNDVNISQQLVKIIYREPQFLWLSFGFGREEFDADKGYLDLAVDEIDDALCFHAAGAYYILPNLEFGIPTDLSAMVEYSRARHDYGDDTLTHQRIIGTANVEWDFPPATPYIRLGTLHAKLDSSQIDEKNTTVFFAGGVRFSFAQGITIGAEFNLSEDIGFGASLGYYF